MRFPYVFAIVRLPAVAGLTAKTGTNSIQLDWEEVPGADAYVVYRKIGDGPFEHLYLVRHNSFHDLNASNTAYCFYRVYAVRETQNEAGPVRYFGQSLIYVWSIGRLGKADPVSTTAGEGQSVLISWTPVSGADGYRVYRKTGNTGVMECVLDSTTETEWTDLGAAPLRVNYYWIVPFRQSSTGEAILGPFSTVSSIVPNLATVSSVRAKNVHATAHITWEAVNGADSYTVYRKVGKYGALESLDSVPGSSLSWTDPTPVPGEYNFYFVQPLSNLQDPNTTPTFTTYGWMLPELGSVGKPIVRPHDRGALVIWPKLPRVSYYNVYRKLGSDQRILIGRSNVHYYLDHYASIQRYNFYWVEPVLLDGETGESFVGEMTNYGYGKRGGQHLTRIYLNPRTNTIIRTSLATPLKKSRWSRLQ